MQKLLKAKQQQELLETLRVRFEENMRRHPHTEWVPLQAKLETHPHKLWSLCQMEQTGGEPDLVEQDAHTGEYIFYDCAAQSPEGRRSLCYDRKALDARQAAKPKNSAMDLANSIGIEILTEEQYRALQQLGEFDTKTSSWLQTPEEIRKRGGAIFGDRRYDHVFVYHNGADSYYAARGFRGVLKV